MTDNDIRKLSERLNAGLHEYCGENLDQEEAVTIAFKQRLEIEDLVKRNLYLRKENDELKQQIDRLNQTLDNETT